MTEPGSLLGARLVQPDERSCGAAVLVVARALLDRGYAELLVSGRHPGTGFVLPGSLADRFRHETLAMHARVTGLVDAAGRLQVPWPRALGTPPWAVARQLSAPGSLPRVDCVNRLGSSVVCVAGRRPTWSWRRDLNPRPADYKSAALPD